MFADRIRGGAGFVFSVLALLLLRGGSGTAEVAAAPGCKDDPGCYAETREEGVMGPSGFFITSHTTTCQGDCVPGQECAPIKSENADGTSTIQCSCDPESSPASCSGFATVDSKGQVQNFSCQGDCGSLGCHSVIYNVQTDRNCPTGGSRNRKCTCD